jgi:uncharacterized membrane protein YfcA
MALDPWQWTLAALCALLTGLAKTGVPGLGILVVPLMLFAVSDPVLSTGTALVLLCAADLFAVAYYRRSAHWPRLLQLSPWVGLGLGLGMVALHAFTAYHLDEALLTRLIAVIVLAMIVIHLLRRRFAAATLPRGWWVAASFGVLAGFATTLANAAGPVMNLYLLSMALPKEEFMGTGAWFFCIINLVKVPLFIAQDRITVATLEIDAWLLPGIVLGALLGRRIFTRVPQQAFEAMVLVLATVATAALFLHH